MKLKKIIDYGYDLKDGVLNIYGESENHKIHLLASEKVSDDIDTNGIYNVIIEIFNRLHIDYSEC